ncbi:MAG: hypothetical protein AB7O26_08515 [Planctomycetaceae bacterium]
MVRFILPVFAIACGICSAAPSANAQSFEVAKHEPGSAGTLTTLVSKPEIVSDAFKKFDLKKPAIQESLKSELSRPNFIANGVTLYLLKPQIGTATFRFVATDSFEIDVTENVLPFCMTKSAASDPAPEPSGEIRFDIRVRGTLHLPTKETPQIAVTEASISVAKIAIKPGKAGSNASSEIEKASNSIAKMNKDRNVFRSAFDRYLRMEFNDQINKGLRPINKKIAEEVKKGFVPNCSLNGEALQVIMSRE